MATSNGYGRIMELSSADRVVVAQLTGTAARHASGKEASNARELREEPGDPVADLHAISWDPRLLTVAAAMYVDSDTWNYAAKAAELLRQAGADLDQARAWKQAHPSRGWRTPQAQPGGGQTNPS
jgi:hypothetical protein